MTEQHKVQLSDLMSPFEMKSRLFSGEDPVDLSIEKWERILGWVKGNPDRGLDLFFFNSESCALCEVYENDCLDIAGYECPLITYLGFACDLYHPDTNAQGPWAEFFGSNSLELEPVRRERAAKAMLDALRKCMEQKKGLDE